jgi:hypothetical protein
MKLVYGRGAANLSNWTYMVSPRSPFRRLESFMKYPRDTDWLGFSFILIGAGFMLLICFMRLRFIW